MESIAIVGGGITGIATALELAKSNLFRITLFEKEPQLGGLSSYYQWQDVTWDRFYHVILSTDGYLLEFIEELDLQKDLFWCKTKTGFYGDGNLVSLSSILDFVKFPFLNPWHKLRLAAGIIYCSRVRDASELDKITARQWLTKLFGRQIYENIWDPLLRSKLGDASEKTSAAFIWATIRRLYGARDSGAKREKMGHVRGGYRNIVKTAEKKLSQFGVTVMTNTAVLRIHAQNRPQSKPGDKDNNKPIKVVTEKTSSEFNKVLFTVSSPQVLRILRHIDPNPYWQHLKRINYLGIICVFLVLSRKLSPYYVINLLDRDLPFTGIIEVSNVFPMGYLGDKHLVYLPKYLTADHPFGNCSENQLIEMFVKSLKVVFPGLKNEEILHRQVFSEKHVQPLLEMNYLNKKAGFRTPFEGVYLANTSMIYNSTLNNNAAIKLAKDSANSIIKDKVNTAV